MAHPKNKELRNFRKQIGRTAHEIRVKKKITLMALSKETDIAINRIDHFEMGGWDMEIGMFYKICTALGTTPQEFFNRCE